LKESDLFPFGEKGSGASLFPRGVFLPEEETMMLQKKDRAFSERAAAFSPHGAAPLTAARRLLFNIMSGLAVFVS